MQDCQDRPIDVRSAGQSLYAEPGNVAAPSESGVSLPTVTSTGSTITLAWESGLACGHSLTIERQEAFTRDRYVQVGFVTSGGRGMGAALAWTDDNLPPGFTYNYRIADAVAGKELSRFFIQASTLLVPRPPTSLVGEVCLGARSFISLAWACDSADAAGCRIERRPGRLGSTSFEEIAVVWANETTFSDYGVQPNTPYNYRLFAFNSLGDSSPSHIVTVTLRS